LRVIASRSDSILTNAAREANIYYVAHVDYILYIGGLKPKGERVIFVYLPRGASAETPLVLKLYSSLCIHYIFDTVYTIPDSIS
jgi:hypothetical protein